MITQERLKELFNYDPETGLFTRKTAHNRWQVGSVIGYKNTDGYVEAGVDKQYFGVHRLAFLFVHGYLPEEIDHINGDKADNRIANLRTANRSINAQNKRKAPEGSRSGVLGVTWHKASQRWVAQISLSGKKTHLGCFHEVGDAAVAYLEAKRKIHEGCTI